MDRMCAACNEPCGTAHDCIFCRKPVHSIVMCEAVWMPNENRYLCGKECVVAHNQKKVHAHGPDAAHDSWVVLVRKEGGV